MYVEQCGYFDNGRLNTWLPYKRNSSTLVHEISEEPLLGEQEDKYYAYWYRGPQYTVPDMYDGQYKEPDQCSYAYFGLVEKYENILHSSLLPGLHGLLHWSGENDHQLQLHHQHLDHEGRNQPQCDGSVPGLTKISGHWKYPVDHQ